MDPCSVSAPGCTLKFYSTAKAVLVLRGVCLLYDLLYELSTLRFYVPSQVYQVRFTVGLAQHKLCKQESSLSTETHILRVCFYRPMC